ncbi:MAG: NADH-quinone oxidoreductase subunit J [bacterium]
MTLNLGLLILMVAAAVATVLVSNLLYSAIGLAVTSVVLTLLMFQLNAPLAGVFELSVCAGLITAVFISAISLTRPGTSDEREPRAVARLVVLPLLVAAVASVFFLAKFAYRLPVPPAAAEGDVREVLWNSRQFDLLGLVMMILAGVFGIVILFKERFRHD